MSYKVYPVVKLEDNCADYEVFVNGDRAELNTARVSAVPFNRRWPGKQRQKEQTELVNFLSMESDEEIELKIIPKTQSEIFRIRPRSIETNSAIDANGVITVKVKGEGIFTVEPYGKNRALHVFIDPVSNYNRKFDENTIYFGAGEHNIGDIYLKDGQTLFIDEGAVVYATVYALHAKNIKVLGRGILDNSKSCEKILYETSVCGNTEAVANAKREHCMNFLCCDGVKIDGITIRDSLLYNVECISCSNICINDIKIIGSWRFNSDGVHFSNCINATLENSFIRTFDDCVCVRGYANYEYDRFLNEEPAENLQFECRDILIRNCVVWNDWGKNLQVGTETYSKEITNVRFEGSKLIHASSNALAVWLVDNAKIHGVSFVNTEVEFDEIFLPPKVQNSDTDKYLAEYEPDFCAALVNFTISWHSEYSLIKSREELGEITDVKIENLNLVSLQKPKFVFKGNNPHSIVDRVEFDNVMWNGVPISKELFEEQTEKNSFVGEVVLR